MIMVAVVMAVMCAGGGADHDHDGGDDNTADDVVSAHLALTGGRDSLSCQSFRAAREALSLHKVPNLPAGVYKMTF